MNDTDNAIAPILYEYIVDFEKEIYKNEERREDSLMQQAANMQMVFSFVSAAVLMITPTIFEYRGALSVEFIILVISSISGLLLEVCFVQQKHKNDINVVYFLALMHFKDRLNANI